MGGRNILILCCLLAGVAAGGIGGPAAAGMMQYRTLSTGVGKETRQPHPEYSLLLIFAAKGEGDLVAGITVRIYRRGKQVLKTVSPEPWLFVDLPPGDYAVAAENEQGVRQGARFSIEDGGQKRVVLAW